MAKIETQYVLVGRDKTKTAFGSLRRNVGAASRSIFNLRNAFIGLGAATALRGVADAGIALDRIERSLAVATGSTEGARKEFDFLRATSSKLGLELRTTAESYSGLAAAARGTALQGEQTREVFLGVSQASRALGLSADQTQGALRAIEQIISKGTVQAEELRGQLGERIPGAFQIAARAIGATTEELNKMLEQGQVISSDFLPKFGKQLTKEFGEAATKAGNDAQAAINNFSTAIFNLQAAIARSGVLDSLAAFAKGIASVIDPLAETSTSEEIARVRKEIKELALEIQRADANPKLYGGGQGDRLKRLVGLRTELELLQDKQERANKAEIAALEIHQSTAEALPRATAALKKYREERERVRVALAKYREEQERVARHESAHDGIEAANKEFAEILKKQADEMERNQKELEKTKRAAQSLGLTFASAFEDAIVQGKGLREVLKGIYQDILRIIARKTITEPLAGYITGAIGSVFGGASTPSPIKPSGGGGPGTYIPGLTTSGKAVTVVQNLDFSTATDPNLINALPVMLEQNKNQTIAEIQGLRASGRF